VVQVVISIFLLAGSVVFSLLLWNKKKKQEIHVKKKKYSDDVEGVNPSALGIIIIMS